MRKLLSVIVAMVFAMSLGTAALAAEPEKKAEPAKPAAQDNTAPAKAAPAEKPAEKK